MNIQRFVAIFLCLSTQQFFVDAQDVYVGAEGTKVLNFQSFTPNNSREISRELLQLTDPKFYAHPEFGTNPYDTPCEDCIEEIDKRTDNTRYFVKKGTSGSYFYKQTSNIDLHYKNEKGEYITIDARLKPTATPNIYKALQQTNYTELNLNAGYSEVGLLENNYFRFNSNLTIASSDKTDGSDLISTRVSQFNDHSVGNDGAVIKTIWPGIDLQMEYLRSSVKSSFILENLNSISTDKSFTIIDDAYKLSGNLKLMYDIYEGSFNENGIWVGDILIVDEFEREYARISKGVIFDAADSLPANEKYSFLMGYKIIQTDGNNHLQIYINNNYLKNPNRIFPVVIDPLVSATTNWSGTNGSEYTPSWCSMILNVTTPANATLTNASLYWEVVGSVLGTCGVAAASKCFLDKANVYVSTSCDQSPSPSGWWICGGACASYGTWLPTVYTASLVTCLTPQCAAYTIPFTYYLRRTACSGGTCQTNCIKVIRFDVTIEGHTIETTMLTGGVDLAAYTITDCVTQTVTFTAGGTYGVSPYTYVWSPSGGTGATDTYTFTGGTTTNVTVTITDACGNTISDLVVVTDPCAPLPVELTSFNGYGQNNKNYLFWTTQSEQNNDSFIIERALDGIHFEAIGSVDGAGNSNAEINYSFIDEKPFAHINYYRLKQLDLNGDYSYSEVVAIYSDAIDKNSVSLNSFNSENSQMDLTVISTTGGGGTFRIVDMTGKTIFQKTVSIEPGINSVLLFPDIYSTGAYILSFMKEDMFENIKFER